MGSCLASQFVSNKSLTWVVNQLDCGLVNNNLHGAARERARFLARGITASPIYTAGNLILTNDSVRHDRIVRDFSMNRIRDVWAICIWNVHHRQIV